MKRAGYEVMQGGVTTLADDVLNAIKEAYRREPSADTYLCA
ncbi:hypothetical protein ACFLW6_00985 [Chloroflexota bacterium]